MLLSQEPVPADTVSTFPVLITEPDSAVLLLQVSPDAIDKQVKYSAVSYIRNDLSNKRVILVNQAVVTYDDIEIKADSIFYNMKTNTIIATGRKDSTGAVQGKPYFKSGSQEFEADTLKYNFKTKYAFIRNIVTQQDEGLLHSSVTKLMDDGTSNVFRSTYSTCDAEIPHFYINLRKARIYPGEKIVSGPGNLVLEGIPLPLFIPFGYFPVQTASAASGILIPKPHYEEGRGYALTDGGYYFAINNYFDLTLRGNLFTNGSWLTNASTNYNKLYKFRGSFSFSYANNITGHKGLSDYNKSVNYNIAWSHSQDPKSMPGSRFSASVNMSSSGYDRNNSYTVSDHVTTQRQSSVSYAKSWTGYIPLNLTASMNHSQNVKNQTVSLNLPRVSLTASRIYPLKRRNATGPSRWYEELQLQYTANLDNKIDTKDSLLFTNQVWKNMRSGFSHEIPVSFQFRPFRNFAISPSLSYRGVLYTQKINKTWIPDYINPENNKPISIALNDTLRGFFYGHALNPSISAGYSPQIFGIFQFTNPESRVQAVRHVMKPSVSFSYVPSFNGLSSSMYRQVQVDTLGTLREYSIFEGGIFGTPSLSTRSGNLALNLTNIIEAKVFEKDDTTGKPKNVKLIDNFNISTAYNVFADSLNWAPVSMVMRTSLFEKINISANSSWSLYGINSTGRSIGTYYFQQSGKLMRLSNLSMGLDFSLDQLLKGFGKKPQSAGNQNNPSGIPQPAGPQGGSQTGGPETVAAFDDYGYAVFNVPWTMNVSYSMNYTNLPGRSRVVQTLSANGSVSLTRRMNMTYTTGYDFARKEITMTQIHINRDLHCWEMSFDWIPNGYMKMWTFTIRVKAAVLADLKYERRKDYHDNY